MDRATFIEKLTEVRRMVDHLLAQLQASDHERFVAHLYQARKQYRRVCERPNKGNKAIERYFSGLLSPLSASSLSCDPLVPLARHCAKSGKGVFRLLDQWEQSLLRRKKDWEALAAHRTVEERDRVLVTKIANGKECIASRPD